ncbi:MAG: zinc ribbon domain-containing protein [Pseudolysinimonas sp.]
MTLIVLLIFLAIFIPIGIWQSQVRKRRMAEHVSEFQRLAQAAGTPPPPPALSNPATASIATPVGTPLDAPPLPTGTTGLAVPTSGQAPDPAAQYRTATPNPTNNGKTPHKYQWNGVDATTSLTPDGIRLAVQSALLPFRGSVTLDTSNPSSYTGLIKSWAGVRMLTFDIEISEMANGWRAVRTSLIWWRTSQTTLFYFIPLGPKRMDGHQTYLDYVQMLGTNLRSADPSAAISFRSGPMPPNFDLAALGRILQAPAVSSGAPLHAAPVATALAPPPPPTTAAPPPPPPPAAATTWTCPNCGAADPESTNFCVECGTPRPEAAAAPVE